MRKILMFFSIFCLFALVLLGCQNTTENPGESSNEEKQAKIDAAVAQIVLPNTPIKGDNLALPTIIDDVEITWSSSNNEVVIIDEDTTRIIHQEEETHVQLIGNFRVENYSKDYTFEIVISAIQPTIEEIINQKLENFKLVESTKEDIELPLEYEGMIVTWKSNARAYLSDDGKVSRDVKDRNVTLTGTFTYEGTSIEKKFVVKVLKYSNIELLQIVSDSLTLPEETNQDIILYLYHDYDVIASWSSSNPDIVTDDGKVSLPEEDTVVTFTVILTLGEDTMEKTIDVKILSKNTGKMHQVIERAQDFDFNKFVGVSLKDNKLVLNEGVTEGYYESEPISTMSFNELVASWAAVSSKNATVEIMVKARINDVWSDYISYYPWGLGLQNKCYDQTKSTIKLTDDEVKVLNNQYADAIMYKIILRRTSSSYDSPILSLVSFALNNPSYTYKVDLSDSPSEKCYDVPKLYQGAVPTIGNSICSPTTSTMLLKYKGEDFSQYDQYEHRYIANLFKDYGNDMFGNWVYCTVGMSSYGYDAYVARMYSIDELVKHLATVGPVGLSVKGQMTSNEKDYYTAGHLLVCVGYRYDVNGNLILLCNDPNVPNVYCEYTEQVMKNTWRYVAYIIE